MVLNDFCVLQTLPEDNLDYHSRSNVSYVQMFGEISQNFNFSKINERMHFKTIPENQEHRHAFIGCPINNTERFLNSLTKSTRYFSKLN